MVFRLLLLVIYIISSGFTIYCLYQAYKNNKQTAKSNKENKWTINWMN